uniref:Uncharacterized protein n=1 Tax=Anguilla anguilla TaxID=7936 RepID=A0A0E9RZJ1_ANGAN
MYFVFFFQRFQPFNTKFCSGWKHLT